MKKLCLICWTLLSADLQSVSDGIRGREHDHSLETVEKNYFMENRLFKWAGGGLNLHRLPDDI